MGNFWSYLFALLLTAGAAIGFVRWEENATRTKAAEAATRQAMAVNACGTRAVIARTWASEHLTYFCMQEDGHLEEVAPENSGFSDSWTKTGGSAWANKGLEICKNAGFPVAAVVGGGLYCLTQTGDRVMPYYNPSRLGLGKYETIIKPAAPK